MYSIFLVGTTKPATHLIQKQKNRTPTLVLECDCSWRRARDSRLCDLPDKMSTGLFSPSDKLLKQFSPYSHPSPFSQKKEMHNCIPFFWRRARDSNPRGLAPKRFSRPPRYDHFDSSPIILSADNHINRCYYIIKN